MTPSLFGPAATFGVGGYPVGLAAGDFTGQGLPDLVAVNQGDTSISILLNHGGGSFTSGETISFGSFLAYAVTGDFTGNGKIDIAVTDESGGTVDVLLGNGDGTFQAPRSFAAGRTPYTLATGDFTNDGKLDLVVVNGPTVSFLKGNGDGTFQAPQAIVNLGSAGAAQNVAVADLNNDGNSDVVVTVNSYSGTGGSLLVLLGHGNGTFTLAENYASTTGYSGVAVGDFNRDGKPDVAATGLNGKVAMYMGGGDGSLQNTDSYAVAGGPSYAIAAADFNADGATDLVTANSGNNTVSVLLCRTDGKFVLEGTYPVAYSPEDVIVADLNRDGLPDLAVTGGTANVSVLMNQYAYHTLLTFDDVPSGTVINNQYPGVTLSQRVSGALPGVYAQTPPSEDPAASSPNVIGIYSSRQAAIVTSFDEYYDPFGIVRATFSIPQGIVSIDAKLVLAPGSYGYPLYNRPYLKAYDANGNLLGAKYYSIANHTQYPRFFPYQTLTFTTPANNIAYVELSAEAPQGDTTARVYGEFDNLQFGYDPVATSMQVTTPSSAADGTPFNMTVTCLDQHGYPFPSFTGTVHFTSSDTQAGLPADYTFTAADAGTHTFPVTLNTPGVQTVTAADSADGLQATSPGIAVSVGPATHFRVTASATGTAGVARSFTVTALDADNNVATGYTGTVHFSSTDLKATLPAAYAFTAADGGTHQFSVTLKTAGSQTVTVTGTDLPAGAVGAWRAEGNAQDSVGGNNGTLQGGATFAPGEAGQAFNFNGNGQYVTVPYSPGLALNTFTVAAWVNLGANPGDFGILGTRVGGEYTFDLQILAGKVHGDVGTGSGWINTSVDYPATLPPGTWHLITYVIDNGAKRFSLYLDGALQGNPISFTGTPLFMAPGETLEIGYGSLFQDYFNGRIDEVQIYNRALGAPEVQGIFVNGSAGEFQPIVYTAPVTVSPAAATTLSITGLPSSTVAGTAVSFTVTAYDAYGNVATGYAGTVHFTGTDAMATLPADYTFTGTDAGRHTFSVTFQTAGTQSITATDKATSSIAGTTSVVVSAPSATATFVKQDTTTQGTWIGTYGAQGYDVINSSASLPSYATVAPSGQASYTWAAATTDPRALQVPGTTNRIAACWYSPTGFSVDLNLTDGQKHNLELYLLDWDSTSRAETVQVSDAASGAVLSTQSVSSFHAGAYLDYTVSGHVVITFTRTAGANAVLSGLFIG